MPPRAVDAGIALACYLATVLPAHKVVETSPATLLLAALASIPLVWRRRYPFPVTVACGAGTIGLALVHGLGDMPLGQLVATYTLAAVAGARARLVGGVGTLAGTAFCVLYLSNKLGELAITMTLFVAAWALGTSTRARHDRIALLEERGRRQAEERESAASRERERIARDMHDILAHSISLIAVQAEAGPVLVRTNPERAERVFDTIGETARETLTQLRRTLGVLRGESGRAPQPDLDGVAELAERAREAGLAVAVEERGDPRTLPPELGLTAYRVVQESLTNVVRHARASQVWIRLEWAEDRLGVAVSDDGRGPGEPNGGHGLIGMRERVNAVGGTLRTGAGPDGKGFLVSATLPVGTHG
ncbi:two-component sensor histidine kinase [Phytohabitans rumicis]|uniref:histidine kinase n=1 Tax=Phytohabitans rumicis TaxID=1076125 RepID=A0A6V8L4W8_9ACTN|nr:two-component sensor histidine kinase [Phytohabitans rumicis]